MINRGYRKGLAGRRLINHQLRLVGQEPAPGSGAGVHRFARWLKRVQFGQPTKPSFARSMRYLNRGTRIRFEQTLTGDTP